MEITGQFWAKPSGPRRLPGASGVRTIAPTSPARSSISRCMFRRLVQPVRHRRGRSVGRVGIQRSQTGSGKRAGDMWIEGGKTHRRTAANSPMGSMSQSVRVQNAARRHGGHRCPFQRPRRQPASYTCLSSHCSPAGLCSASISSTHSPARNARSLGRRSRRGQSPAAIRPRPIQRRSGIVLEGLPTYQRPVWITEQLHHARRVRSTTGYLARLGSTTRPSCA